jgi:cytoskeletal protein RodZ
MRSSPKKSFIAVFVLAFSAAILSPSFASPAPSEESSASDVVVLLDVSQSVFPYFHDVTDYVVSSVVRDFLRTGDTFHLLSFGDVTQVEIAQRVSGEEDVRSILGRLYLLYPLARHTDIISAFSYLYQYLADLPENRSKIVVVITDGIDNPAEGSPSFGLSADDAAKALSAEASKIRANGWQVYIIRVPFSAERAAAEAQPKAAASGAQAAAGGAGAVASSPEESASKLINGLASSLGANVTEYAPSDKEDVARKSLSLPLAEFPAPLGKKGYAFSFPLKVKNDGDTTLALELDHVVSDGSDILQKKSFLSLAPRKSGTMDVHVALSPALEAGAQNLGVELYFADGIRVSPSHGTLSFELSPNPLSALFKSGSRIVLFVILLAAGLFIVLIAVLLLSKRAPRKAAEPIVRAVRESAEEKEAAKKARDQSPARAAAERPRPAMAAEARGALPGGDNGAVAQGLAEARGAAPLAPNATSEPNARVAPITSAARATPPAQPARAPEERSGLPLKKTAKAAKRPQKETVSRPRTEGAAASQRSAAPSIVRPGNIQIELRVADQNPSIGLRNVQLLQAGTARSVGGGRSDFLVFLVPVPHRVAELEFDGEQCTFVPLMPDYFPELSAPLADCLGKDIVMVSRHGYRMVLRFSRFVAPKDRINRLLHCIETPGLFEESED